MTRRLALAFVALAVLAALATPALPAQAATPPLHPLGALRPAHPGITNYRALGVTALAVPPASANLRAYAVPVGDQGAVGSCVAWALDYGMLGWYSRKTGRVGQPFAPMFLYSQINGGVDNGSSPLTAMDYLQAQGSDTQAHYSHDNYDWRDQPTDAEKAYAGHWKLTGLHTVWPDPSHLADYVTAIKNALATNHPVGITLPVRPGFDNMGHLATSIDNDYTGAIRGYHEVLAVGYDATGLVFQNSWGTAWGAAGFGKLSWNVVMHDVEVAVYADGFAPDTATPVVTNVTATPVVTGSIGTTTVPYRISWTSLGTIASYTVTYSANGGAQVPVTLSSAKATSYMFNATPGATYAFSVQATDALAQTSATITSAPFTPTLLQESDGSIAYSGVWTAPAVSLATGGAIKMTPYINASATVTTTANTLSWIATKGSNRGSAKIYVDGVYKATVNLYALVGSYRTIAYTFNFGASGVHSMQIVNLGTAFHPIVDVDAFVATN